MVHLDNCKARISHHLLALIVTIYKEKCKGSTWIQQVLTGILKQHSNLVMEVGNHSILVYLKHQELAQVYLLVMTALVEWARAMLIKLICKIKFMHRDKLLVKVQEVTETWVVIKQGNDIQIRWVVRIHFFHRTMEALQVLSLALYATQGLTLADFEPTVTQERRCQLQAWISFSSHLHSYFHQIKTLQLHSIVLKLTNQASLQQLLHSHNSPLLKFNNLREVSIKCKVHSLHHNQLCLKLHRSLTDKHPITKGKHSDIKVTKHQVCQCHIIRIAKQSAI